MCSSHLCRGQSSILSGAWGCRPDQLWQRRCDRPQYPGCRHCRCSGTFNTYEILRHDGSIASKVWIRVLNVSNILFILNHDCFVHYNKLPFGMKGIISASTNYWLALFSSSCLHLDVVCSCQQPSLSFKSFHFISSSFFSCSIFIFTVFLLNLFLFPKQYKGLGMIGTAKHMLPASSEHSSFTLWNCQILCKMNIYCQMRQHIIVIPFCSDAW